MSNERLHSGLNVTPPITYIAELTDSDKLTGMMDVVVAWKRMSPKGSRLAGAGVVLLKEVCDCGGGL